MLKIPGGAAALGRIFAVFLLLLSPIASASALIYKNQGCGHCGPYVEELVAMLEKNGRSDYVVKDFMSDSAARAEMVAIQEKFGVPLQMQGHMLVLIDDRYLFEGHVPAQLIESYLKNSDKPVVVTQDKMSGATDYQMLMNGKIETCDINELIQECDGHGSEATAQADSHPLESNLLPFILLLAAGGAILYYTRGG